MSNQTILSFVLVFLSIILSISYVTYTKRKYKNTLLRVKRQHIEELLEAQGVPPMDYVRIKSLWKEAISDASFDDSYFKKLSVDFLTRKLVAMNTASDVFLLFDSYKKAINPIVPDQPITRLIVSIHNHTMDNTWSHLIELFQKKLEEILDKRDETEKEEFLRKFSSPALYRYLDNIKSILSITEQNYVATE